MTNKLITIHNAETDEIITREMTDEEIEIENTPGEFDEQIKDELTIKEEARAALLDKLGITADEAKLLLG